METNRRMCVRKYAMTTPVKMLNTNPKNFLIKGHVRLTVCQRGPVLDNLILSWLELV